MAPPMKAWIRLLRPKEYTKNFIIFLPLFFGMKFNQGELVAYSALAFLLFSLLASAVYIMNDLRDVEADRKHPVKRLRPIAAGLVSPRLAWVAVGGLFLCSLVPAFLWSRPLFVWMVVYLAVNLAYTHALKHVAILDVFILASGFVIRLYVGKAVTDTTLSHWIILMIFLGALFIGFAKRRDDLLLSGGGESVRRAISGYNLEFVHAAMVFMAAVTVVCYILYTTSPEVVQKWGEIFPSTAFVLFGILRWLQLAFVKNRTGSPVDIILHDRYILGSAGLFLLYYGFIIYFHYRFNMSFHG
ncbi:MAG: UbiA prenyltransferase family protein [Spirochaetes bacterium]|nr:UbiA prenyltransferase family protein [Spirochaetota bacterium]